MLLLLISEYFGDDSYRIFFLVSEYFGRNFCKEIFCPMNILEIFLRDLSAINIRKRTSRILVTHSVCFYGLVSTPLTC